LGGGGVDLLTLRRAHALHGFRAIDDALTLLWRHIVELGEAVAQVLLDLRAKLAEAGFLFEGALLLVQWLATMGVHPFAEVRAEGVSVVGPVLELIGAGLTSAWLGCGRTLASAATPLLSARTSEGGGRGRERKRTQHDGGQKNLAGA
jgi:hypothetical protein